MSHDTIRVVEVFKSIQGEGAYVGVPSVFVRLFGCNLQCEGFGMPVGQKSTERHEIAAHLNAFDTVDTLPLVRTGCDSYAAWDKRFRHLSKEMTVGELADQIELVHGKSEYDGTHLVITGGEPLLPMWSDQLYRLVIELTTIRNLFDNITFETNGTQIAPEWLDSVDANITFSISPKMRASGERRSKAWIDPAFKSMFYSGCDSFLKFVVKDEADVLEVNEYMEYMNLDKDVIAIYLMPVGGCLEEYRENLPDVAKLALEHGYRLSPRLHIDAFGNSWGA